MHLNHLVLVLAAALPLAAQNAVISAPVNGSTLQAGSTVTFTWNAESNPANTYYHYYLALSANPGGGSDLGLYSTNNTSQAVTVPSSVNALYAQLGQWAGNPATWYTSTASYPVVTLSMTVQTIPGTDPTAGNPNDQDPPSTTIYVGDGGSTVVFTPSQLGGVASTFQLAATDDQGNGFGLAGILIAPSPSPGCAVSGNGTNTGALMNPALRSACVTVPNTCEVMYDGISNVMWLNSDSGGFTTANGVTPGASATLSNNACSVAVSGASASQSAGVLNLSVPVTFNASFVGAMNVYVYTEDDEGNLDGWTQVGTFNANPPAGTDDYIPVRMESGEIVRVKRADKVDIGKLTYASAPDGVNTKYTYTFDNREVEGLHLGDMDASFDVVATTQPAGWVGGGKQSAAWSQWKPNVTLSATAEYSVTSPKLPGVVPLFLQNAENSIDGGVSRGVTVGRGRSDNTNIQHARSIFNNSRMEMVIGPVFDQTPTMADVMAQVKIWAQSDYGLTFLAPLLTSSEQRAALEGLTPRTQLERDTVTCLRNVFAVAH